MKMNQTLLLCSIILAVHTCSYLASSSQHLKTIHKRLVNGSPINDFERDWFFTATLDIFHYSNGVWQRHPICLGSFFRLGEKHLIITAADCFFPPGYNHAEFSYMSKGNYRVFLGIVRIRYGTINYSNVNRFGMKSTNAHPIVVINPVWQYGNSNEDTNIAIIPISSNCIAKLNEGVTKGLISDLPQYLNLPDSDELVRDYCAVAGWKTDLPDGDVFAPNRDHRNLNLTIGQFVPLNSSTCNRYFSMLNIPKRLEDSQFCLSGIFSGCIEVYLSHYEYGSGVVCNGLWNGFISAIFSVAPRSQFATVTRISQIHRFVDAAHLSDGSHTCVLSQLTPTNLGRNDGKVFNPSLAKDYASP